MITVATFTALIARVLPEPYAGLLSGILFGVKTTLSSELTEALITTGTLHIVALSGMNITILTQLFCSTFLLVLPRRIASILTIGVIAIFVLFVGPSPSVVRAAIMGCISILATITGRISTALITWGITIASMIVFQPGYITNVSFQLSALASLGMIVCSKPVAFPHKRHGIWTFIHEELVTTLSAQVFTLPVLLFTFGRLSLISPITNILIGWTIPIITVLGLLICFFGLVWFPLGQILAWCCWVFLEWLIQSVLVTSRIPFASINL